MLSVWDCRLARRAAALAVLTALLTLLVVATTDEGAPAAQRLGMVAALLPVASSIGALAAIRIAEGRGELRALAAIGVDPARAVRGAILGGVAVAVLAPVLAASPFADLRGLFPQPVSLCLWGVDGAGMLELTQGILVEPGGALTLLAPVSEPAPIAAGKGAPLFFTVVALGLAALSGPRWIAAPSPLLRRGVALTLALLLAIVSFQGVAADRLPSAVLLGAPLLLLLDSARLLSR